MCHENQGVHDSQEGPPLGGGVGRGSPVGPRRAPSADVVLFVRTKPVEICPLGSKPVITLGVVLLGLQPLQYVLRMLRERRVVLA
jgi:hypothetical protein